MDPQSVNQNSSESEPTSSAVKFFSVELLILVFLAVVILVTLNYFNVLSLSRMFPGALGWLPHKSITQIVQETSTPISTVSSQDKLTPEARMLSYAEEVLRSEFVPSSLQNVQAESRNDQTIYKAERSVNNNIQIKFSYAETEGNDSQKTVASPLSLIVLVYVKDNSVINQENFENSIEGYYKDLPVGESRSFKRFNTGSGASVLELIWENNDGTKEARSTFRSAPVVLNGNPHRDNVFVACRMYKASSTYDKNTCYE